MILTDWDVECSKGTRTVNIYQMSGVTTSFGIVRLSRKIINSITSPDTFLSGLNLESGCSDTLKM